MRRPPIRNASSTALWLAETLKHAIIMGTLPPDETLQADELAETYEVGLTVVHEVFAILKRDNWVRAAGNRRAVVSPLRAEDVLEVFEARAALEVEAARQSFPNLTNQQIAAAERAHRALEDAVTEERAEVHAAFHLALYAAAEPSLLEAVEQKIQACERYLCFKRAVLNDVGAEHTEHLAFLNAARVKDAEHATRLIAAHISNCGRLIAQKL